MLLDADSGGVLLADLGVAAVQQKCFVAGAALTCNRPFLQRFSYVGSPAWMAPEIMEQSSVQGWDHLAWMPDAGCVAVLCLPACVRP